MNDPELRAAFARLDKALQDARSALGPEAEYYTARPEPSIQFGGNVRLTVGTPEPEPEPEPEQPSVEVVSALGGFYRFLRITRFQRVPHEERHWQVWGWLPGHGSVNIPIATAATPFSIWQECVRKGVPCCDPPTVTLDVCGGPWSFICIEAIAPCANTAHSRLSAWCRHRCLLST
jgi:hypothetical protein